MFLRDEHFAPTELVWLGDEFYKHFVPNGTGCVQIGGPNSFRSYDPPP